MSPASSSGPPEEAAGGVEHKRLVSLAGSYRDILVGYNRGWDENDIPWPHLDDQLELVQNQVAATFVVEVPEDHDSAQTVCQVPEISMRPADGLRPEIDGHRSERRSMGAGDEIKEDVRVVKDLVAGLLVGFEEVRRPRFKGIWQKPSVYEE